MGFYFGCKEERKRCEKDPRQERSFKEDMSGSSREDMSRSSKEDMSRSSKEDMSRSSKEDLSRSSRDEMSRSSKEDMSRSSREDMSRRDRSSEGGSVRTGKRGLGEGSSRDERDFKGHKSSHGQLKAESNSRVVDQGKESSVNAGDIKEEDGLDAIWTDSSIGLAELEHCMKMLEWDKSKDNSREREKLKRQIEELKLSKLRQSQEVRSPGPAADAGGEELDVNQPYLGPGKEIEKIQEKKRSNPSEARGPEAVSAEALLTRLGQDQCSLLVRSFPDMDEYFGKFGTVAKISKMAHWPEVGRIEFVSRASVVRVLQAEHVRQGLHFYVEPGADKSRVRGHGSREGKRKTKSRSQEVPESLGAAGRVECQEKSESLGAAGRVEGQKSESLGAAGRVEGLKSESLGAAARVEGQEKSESLGAAGRVDGQEKSGGRWRCRDCDHDSSPWARFTTAIAVRIYKTLPN